MVRQKNLYIIMHVYNFTGEKNCTMNIHLLSHLTQCVRDWGPLWTYSCFSFESANNHLKKLFHGTKDMTKQVGVFPSIITWTMAVGYT